MDPDDSRTLERYHRDRSKAETKNELAEVARICNCIAEIYSKYGRHEEAIKEHRQEKQLCEALDDRIGEAVACRMMGECYCAMEQYDQALELQKRHLTLAKECGDALEEQRAWATIGRTYLYRADSRNLSESCLANNRAEKAFNEALKSCEKVKTMVEPGEYVAMKCRLYLNIGLVYDNKMDIKRSIEFISHAVLFAQKHRLDQELLMCYSSLSSVYQNNRQYPQALQACQRGFKLAQKLRVKMQECDLLTCMATIHVAMGSFPEGKHCLKKANKLGGEGDDGKIRTMFKTVNKMQESHQELESTEDADKKSEHCEAFADSLAEMSLYKDAIDYYLKVLTMTHLSEERKAAIYVSLAQTHSDSRQYESAVYYYKKELEVRHDNPEQASRTKLNIAELEELNGGKYPPLCKIYMEAFELAKKAKHPKLMVRSLKSLIVVQRLCEQWKHLEETEKTLSVVRKKHNLGGDCGDGDDDSGGGGGEGDSQEDEDDEEEQERHSGKSDADLSFSDLTVSEDSDDEDEQAGASCSYRKRSNIAKRNEKGETPLHRACIEGSLNKVKKLISGGHPINPRDHCGWIPLHEASNHDYPAIVEYLISKGAWINDRGGEQCGGVTPLIDAACCGNLEVMSILMRNSASLVAKDDNGNTALDCLQIWFSQNGDELSAQQTLKYKNVEKLLRGATGKNQPSKTTNGKTTSVLRGKDQARPKNASSRPGISSSSSSSSSSPLTSHTTHSSNQMGASSAGSRYKRLPDLEDVTEEEPELPAEKAFYKERLLKLKEKRLISKSSKPTRPARKQPSTNHKEENNIGKTSNDPICDDSSHDSDKSFVFAHSSPSPPKKATPNLWNNATETYRQVMESVRGSVQSRTEAEEEKIDDNDVEKSDGENHISKTKKSKITAPFQTNLEVGDDWLVDDLGKQTKGKKRSHEVTSMLNCHQLRTSKQVKKTVSRKGGKRARYGHGSDTTGTVVLEESLRNGNASKNKENVLDELFGLDSEEENENCDNFSVDYQNRVQNIERLSHTNDSDDGFVIQGESRGVNSGPAKLDQSNSNDFWDSDGDDVLLADLPDESFGMDVSIFDNIGGGSKIDLIPNSQIFKSSLQQDCHVSSSSSVDEPRQKRQWVGTSVTTSHSLPTPTIQQSSNSNTSSSSSLPTPRDNNSSTNVVSVIKNPQPPEIKTVKFSVKVNVEGKILLVPVYDIDVNKPMAWLAQQVAERYFRSFFVYPVLTFKTPDGIILGSEDPIGCVVDSIPELHADVQAWNKQSAAERYEKACETFYEKSRSNVKSLLQNVSGVNNKLDLNDLSLGLVSLLPVFKALDGETCLVELKLGGNRLSDSGISSLTKLLSTLPNLKVLVLDSNELTLEGLESLASFVQSGSGLQSLTDLSLGYNCLTDKVEGPIKVLLKSLQYLTSLKLGACSLTSAFFTPGVLQVLRECPLSTLTLSENQLSRETVSTVLQTMSSASSLNHLDLAHTLASNDLEPVLDEMLRPIISSHFQGRCSLQTLSLVGCHLSQNDVLVVNRLPVLIPSLAQLNISQNRNVDNTSLQKLISISANGQNKLQSITARGCSVRSPLGDEFFEALRLKLQSPKTGAAAVLPLTKFVFSCRGLTSAESEWLSGVWMGKWEGLGGRVKASGGIVDLSVSDIMGLL